MGTLVCAAQAGLASDRGPPRPVARFRESDVQAYIRGDAAKVEVATLRNIHQITKDMANS